MDLHKGGMNMKENIQKFGKSLLMPISTIAAAGIFMGLAAALQNTAIVGEAFVQLEGLQLFIGFIRKAAGLVFGNLPVFFAISISVGLAKGEKGTAAFSALLGFLVFHFTINYILTTQGITPDTVSIGALMEGGMDEIAASIENARFETVLGYFTYRMNVFGGVIVGLIVAWLHNKFYKISLPSAVNFFGGKRFVPLATLVVVPLSAVASFFVWPLVDNVISMVGMSISKTGVFGPFIYGTMNRILIPTGLHHILNQLVRFTPIGGSAVIDGQTVFGALNIFNAAIGAVGPVSNDVFVTGAKYIGQGHSLIAIFGLPAAALAMIRTAKPSARKGVKAMFIAGISASFLTGITEPIEFAFMFISPILFGFHAVMSGLGYMVLAILQTSVGGVQAGIIDFTIFGVLRGAQSQWYLVALVGVAFAAAYYFGFKYLIERFNILTPGRADEEFEGDENEKIDRKITASSQEIIEALGGRANIVSITNCMTRLRVEVKDMNSVNDKKLKKTGAAGVFKPTSTNVHVVYGLQVDQIATDVNSAL